MTALRIRSEGVLRSKAARGDAAAFAAVYERHHQALYRYCRSILRHDEDAQDALQSTFTRAFAALQDEQRDFELRPWLFRIAHNEAISILRRRPATDELDEQPALGEIEDRVSEREELRLLQLDLADLPERQRAALVMRELNGLSHQEIGLVLELSTGAVKQAIFDARSALFSFREGREMACHDIRRMLSDGDGRVLRGRGVRGHLRSCPDCRRFKADLETRPKALKALAPPLPVGGAAALLAQLLGGGATAAKLLACVAIAGGGTTLAVEMQHAREPKAAEAATTGAPPRTPKAAPVAATPTAQPLRAQAEGRPKPEASAHGESEAPTRKARSRTQSPDRVRKTTGKATAPGQAGKRDERAAAKKHEKPTTPPGQAKKQKQPTGKATAPGQVKKTEPKPIPPGQAKKDVSHADNRDIVPGQVKKETASQEATVVPPGQAKKGETNAGHGDAGKQGGQDK